MLHVLVPVTKFTRQESYSNIDEGSKAVVAAHAVESNKKSCIFRLEYAVCAIDLPKPVHGT